jgi:hypothetical protein
MRKVRITESQLKGLVRKMIKEEMEDRSYGGYDPMDDEPPFGGSEGSFKEQNPTIRIKGLSIADAIRKIKTESQVRVLNIKDWKNYKQIDLQTYIDRGAGVSEGYTFHYDENGRAATDARFEDSFEYA